MNDKKILSLSQISSFFFLISQGVYTHSNSASISIHQGVSLVLSLLSHSCSVNVFSRSALPPLKDEFRLRFKREIPKLVTAAMAPFYETLEMLLQHLDSCSSALVSDLDSKVDPDSVVNSYSNSSAELGLDSSSQALVLDPDSELDSDSDSSPLGVSDFLSQLPPASQSQFTLPPPPPSKWTKSRNLMVRNGSSTVATLISPFRQDTMLPWEPSDTDPPPSPTPPPKPPDQSFLKTTVNSLVEVKTTIPPPPFSSLMVFSHGILYTTLVASPSFRTQQLHSVVGFNTLVGFSDETTFP